jgi:hypothetical protein
MLISVTAIFLALVFQFRHAFKSMVSGFNGLFRTAGREPTAAYHVVEIAVGALKTSSNYP